MFWSEKKLSGVIQLIYSEFWFIIVSWIFKNPYDIWTLEDTVNIFIAWECTKNILVEKL